MILCGCWGWLEGGGFSPEGWELAGNLSFFGALLRYLGECSGYGLRRARQGLFEIEHGR